MKSDLGGRIRTVLRLRRSRTDRKSTRLNSSHRCISYAVFCLKKKKKDSKYFPHVAANHAQCSNVLIVDQRLRAATLESSSLSMALIQVLSYLLYLTCADLLTD